VIPNIKIDRKDSVRSTVDIHVLGKHHDKLYQFAIEMRSYLLHLGWQSQEANDLRNLKMYYLGISLIQSK
jgi:hypothetical protein